MPPTTPRYIPRMVNLEPRDYRIVRRVAQARGLGGKGFSAALRIIIREWEAYQSASLKTPPPSRGRGRGEGVPLTAEN